MNIYSPFFVEECEIEHLLTIYVKVCEYMHWLTFFRVWRWTFTYLFVKVFEDAHVGRCSLTLHFRTRKWKWTFTCHFIKVCENEHVLTIFIKECENHLYHMVWEINMDHSSSYMLQCLYNIKRTQQTFIKGKCMIQNFHRMFP